MTHVQRSPNTHDETPTSKQHLLLQQVHQLQAAEAAVLPLNALKGSRHGCQVATQQPAHAQQRLGDCGLTALAYSITCTVQVRAERV
jgi:hypothetical protein